jgi:flavin-dependent dehydrogenase
MYDVAVVGAGPAGAATATHLARSNHTVVLIDRAQFPRRKPCGEGLFPAGVAELEALGLSPPLMNRGTEIESVRFEGYGSSAAAPVGTPGHRGLGVARDLLDTALVETAARAGVVVLEGCTVERLRGEAAGFTAVDTTQGRIEGRVLVGADGLNSRLRRLAGLEASKHGDRYGISAHVALSEPCPPQVRVWFEPTTEIYLTPVGGKVANVAVLTRRPEMRRFAAGVEEAFTKTVSRHPALSAGFELLDGPLTAGPFAVHPRREWDRNLVLAGDAAGFFDGISGEGMALALTSARFCAEAIAEYLDSGNQAAFAAYGRKRRALARPSELLARLSLFLAARPALARRSLANMGRHPETFARLVAVNSRDLPLRALRPRDLVAIMGL